MGKRICLKFLAIFVWFAAVPGIGAQVLEEIVVTAQKREQNLQETPVAVTAFADGYLDKFQIDDIEDITSRTPGVAMLSFNRSQSHITMRGAFSANSDVLADRTFGIFVDDVYYSREYEMALDFVDLERIEVLRGPQGTLFGRNVVGGAINVITETPDETPRGLVDVSYGQYDGTGNGIFAVRGKASGPVAEQVFGSLTFKYEDTGGWSENALLDDAEMGGGKITTLRGKLRWAGDTADVVLGANYTKDNGQGTPWFLLVGDPELDPGVVRNTADRTGGKFNDTDVAQVDTAGQNDKELYGLNLHVDWDLPLLGGSTLSSISAWRRSTAYFLNDDLASATTGTNFFFSADNKHKQFTQELRLAGETERLNWMVGAYYLSSDGYFDQVFDVNFGLSGSGLNFLLSNGLLGNPPPYPPFPLGIDGFFGFNDDLRQEGTVKSFALFTHNTYTLNDWLNFTAGLRWTKDKKSGQANNMGNPFPSGIFIIENHNVAFSKSWQAWTPKFILDGTFDEVGPFDTLFVYASVARGFKSGGFVSSVTAEASSTPIEPELVWSYEGGVKSVFWQDRAHLNLTYYRADYKDLQTTIIPTGGRSFLTVNAGKAKVDGIELEAMALLTEQLLFNFTYAWTDARFTSFVIPPDRDFTGNRVAQSPKHSWTADLSYTAQMGPGEAQLSLNYVYRGDSYFDADNATLESIIDDTDFGQLNLTASYRWGDWQVSLWGKNLNDDRAVFNGLTVFGQFSQLSPTEVFAGEPFISGVVSPGPSYGLSVRKIWGDY